MHALLASLLLFAAAGEDGAASAPSAAVFEAPRPGYSVALTTTLSEGTTIQRLAVGVDGKVFNRVGSTAGAHQVRVQVAAEVPLGGGRTRMVGASRTFDVQIPDAPRGVVLNVGITDDPARPAEERFTITLAAKPRPAPTGTPAATKVLPPNIGKGQIVYQGPLPKKPDGMGAFSGFGLYKICVDDAGTVERISVVKPAAPQMDPVAVDWISRLLYRPYSVDGRGVPFCYAMRIQWN